MEHIDALISEIKTADEDRIEAIKAELITACSGAEGKRVREHIENDMKSLVLVIQWELEEVLEATAPAPPRAPEPDPAPKPEPEAAPEAASEAASEVGEPPAEGDPLTAADLDMVYDDPRGLVLHRTKDGKRWFATQVNPNTKEPQTFELHPQEIQQLQTQLAGSPYWQPGAGA
ncbi:MAG: hypothetical protein ACI9VR_000655 [Cognaticolwellia sp.]